jgi:PAS domain S-box-containing protein
MLEQITAIAEGRFEARGAVGPDRDELDAVVACLNVLAEDFGVEVSRRERAEASLRDALDGFEHAPALLCSVDAASGTVLRANATLARTLRREPSELLGQPIHAVYRPGGRAQLDDALAALRERRALPGGDHELVRSDGSTVLFALSGSPVDGPEGVVRLRLAYRDVTEERRLEAQLLQAQKMDGIGRLAGGIAHDFNNLLTAIFGAAEMLAPAVDGDVAAQHDLRQLVGAAERAAELTSQLLAFSRRTVIMPAVVDVNGRLRRFEKLLRRTLGEQIEIVLSLVPDAWLVSVDPGRLEQVILNLAVNARDAMPGGGRLTLETHNVELDDEHARLHLGMDGGEYLQLSVRDDGVGMTREVQEHLFEPFFTTKEVGRGTGLGLAMVYGIVRQSKGAILVDSAPGQGSRFRIYLPRAVELPRQEVAPQVVTGGGGVERVLIIEDDALVRALIVRVLRRAGYHVLEAADGESGVALARRQESGFDLLVTDVVMPGRGGRETAHLLESEGRVQRTLFVSGYTADSIAQHGVAGTDTQFLHKPFTAAGLLARVRAVLDAPFQPLPGGAGAREG